MPQARFDPALPPVALPQAAWEARVLQPALPTVALVSGFEIDQKRQKQTQSIRPVDRPFINYTRNPSSTTTPDQVTLHQVLAQLALQPQ